MSFLKPKQHPSKRETVELDIPAGSAENARVLLQNVTAEELDVLRKVVQNPGLKTLALAQAKKFV